MSVIARSPVHVDAELEPRLSRWLWLVKWFLAIPHYLLLVALWLAFAVTSVIAFFGILVTGRYPRAVFDFNVGVLRWSWRVAYYAYGALGTDRYPPFTLREVADYPAHLEIDYPEHLSRGLVLVKWWLLAIPHYVVLGVFLGGAGYAASNSNMRAATSTGLIGFLVLVAGVVLLFTGRYPARVFDLVLGLNRWVLRVAAYVALMTDTYPPFALDQGGHDPDGVVLTTATGSGPAPSAPPAAPPPPPPPVTGGSPWSTGRVVSLVLGCFAALLALGLVVGGAGLLVAGRTARDSAGYLSTPTTSVSTPGYAVTTERLSMGGSMMGGGSAGSGMPRVMMGDLRVSATSRDPGQALFVGIAPAADVDQYLASVSHCVLRGYRATGSCEEVTGQQAAVPPAQAGIWVDQRTGTGPQSLVWSPESGDWTVVVMNADGSPAVAADLSVGARAPALPWIAGGLLVGGLVVGAGAVALIAIPLRRARPRPTR